MTVYKWKSKQSEKKSVKIRQNKMDQDIELCKSRKIYIKVDNLVKIRNGFMDLYNFANFSYNFANDMKTYASSFSQQKSARCNAQ